MKIKLICLSILLLTFKITSSQNLFTNADFELYSSCPLYNSEIYKVTDWVEVVQNPDYMNCTFSGWASQLITGAQSGTGYVGFASYQNVADATESMGQALQVPLAMGSSYMLQFYAKKTSQGLYSDVCNGICFYGWVANPVVGGAQSHICPLSINGAYLLGCSDTIIDPLWNLYQVSFTAPANIGFIAFAVGCSNLCGENVFMDNISLTLATALNEPYVNEKINIFPLPFSSKLNITGGKNELSVFTLYDMSSRKLLQQSFTNSTSINTEQLAKGIYAYEILNSKGVTRKGKIVKE